MVVTWAKLELGSGESEWSRPRPEVRKGACPAGLAEGCLIWEGEGERPRSMAACGCRGVRCACLFLG